MQQQQDQAQYEQMALAHFEDISQRIGALPGVPKATTRNTFKGNLAIIISGIGYVHVVMTVELSNGQKLRFEGDGGGPILGGGGVAYGGGTSTLSPSQLVDAGPMGWALQATPVGMVFEFKGPGVFVGGGPNIGAGHAWGSGRWSVVS